MTKSKGYVLPQDVKSPKGRVGKILEILYDGGQDTGDPNADNGWAAALLEFDGHVRLGVRWNGSSGRPQGHPSSRAKPTWFIVPPAMQNIFIELIRRFAAGKPFTLSLESIIAYLGEKDLNMTINISAPKSIKQAA